MTTDDHFHPESLEEFTTALGSAGFQLAVGSRPPRWKGSIHPAFGPLTDSATMAIVIAPGWPFKPPAVFIQGLNTNHSTLDGFVCMWQDGDFSHDWTTVEGLFSRIAANSGTDFERLVSPTGDGVQGDGGGDLHRGIVTYAVAALLPDHGPVVACQQLPFSGHEEGVVLHGVAQGPDGAAVGLSGAGDDKAHCGARVVG